MTDKISLKKTGKISLKKASASLKNIEVTFSWKSAVKLDADVSALICAHSATATPRPVMLGPRHLVCYANHVDPERSVFAGEDVQDGTGEEESIYVELGKVNPNAEEIAFIMTIDGSPANGKHFGQITDGYLVLKNKDTGEALVEYNFTSSPFTNQESLVHVASLYRNGGDWQVEAKGQGIPGGDIYSAVDLFGGKSDAWYGETE